MTDTDKVFADIHRRNMARRIDPLEYPQAVCGSCGADPFITPLMDTDVYGVMCIDHKRCAAAERISRGLAPVPPGPSAWED